MKVTKKYAKRHKFEVWSFDLHIDGKRYRDSGFATKAEAERAVASLRLSEREARYGITPSRMKHTTVGIALEAYIKRRIDEMTLRRNAAYAQRNVGDLNRIRRWGKFVGLERQVSSIDADDLLEWTQEEVDRGLRKASVLRGLNTIRAALNFASLKYPDLKSYRVPPVPKGLSVGSIRRRVLDVEEIKHISEVLAGPPPKSLVSTQMNHMFMR